ncbi:hypothetical protein MPER_05102 [Moniliophthora perniciosa FA553]|nr:hypothetical protein MPER_05102 [Moniliophthora perniciosa FA553]
MPIPLSTRIQALHTASSTISVSQLYAFVAVCTRLKNNILVVCPSNHNVNQPPLFLPEEVIDILKGACQMSKEEVESCWNALKEEVWNLDDVLAGVITDRQLQKTFQANGGNLFRV